MSNISPHWKSLSSMSELDHVTNESKYKPVLVFKHSPTSKKSVAIKNKLDVDWLISPEELDVYIVEINKNTEELSNKISEIAGIDNEIPQIVLFADGVTMYDESNDLISFKKIKLALKIITRTFRWLETRA